jgi:hypothetical protein
MLFARSGPVGFLSHLRSLRRYDEQEILHFSLTQFCLMNADAGHIERRIVFVRMEMFELTSMVKNQHLKKLRPMRNLIPDG